MYREAVINQVTNHYRDGSFVVAVTIPSSIEGRGNQPPKPADGAVHPAESLVPSTTCRGKPEKNIPQGTLKPTGA